MCRTTRSQSRQASRSQNVSLPTTPTPAPCLALRSESSPLKINSLHHPFTPKSTGLSRRDTALLNEKRDKLRAPSTQLRRFTNDANKYSSKSRRYRHPELLVQAVEAALVFAQEEAGTAVCIAPDGLLLTCSHCVADDVGAALDAERWLLLATGEVVTTRCVAWDGKRDLALLRIVAAEDPAPPTTTRKFPYAAIPSQTDSQAPATDAALICIGHPGSEDLEVDMPGKKTGYDVLHISDGHYRGIFPGQDPQENSEIGALVHDCWTYWGHSGAPLIDATEGRLVGLHSSWDSETGMRRGVPLEAGVFE